MKKFNSEHHKTLPEFFGRTGISNRCFYLAKADNDIYFLVCDGGDNCDYKWVRISDVPSMIIDGISGLQRTAIVALDDWGVGIYQFDTFAEVVAWLAEQVGS